MSRNSRRAYTSAGGEIPPITLGNMRGIGVRSIIVSCTPCGHQGVVDCDRWPDDFPMPDVVTKLRCSKCGSKRLTSIINVAEMYEQARGRPKG